MEEQKPKAISARTSVHGLAENMTLKVRYETGKQKLKLDYEAAKKKLRAEFNESLRALERADRIARNDRSIQLERLAALEERLIEHFAEAHVRGRLSGKLKGEDSAEMQQFRRIWRSPRTSDDYATINALVGADDPHGWTKVAKKCGISYTVTLYRDQVAHVLGYSMSGIDKLRKQGALPFKRASYRTVTFLPKDVRCFIKSTMKWGHRGSSKRNL